MLTRIKSNDMFNEFPPKNLHFVLDTAINIEYKQIVLPPNIEIVFSTGNNKYSFVT